MSDQSAHKKGMRTFASDFARVKGVDPISNKPKSHTPPTPKPVVVQKKESAPASTGLINKTIQKSSQKPGTPSKIPAFHEIEKAVKNIDVSDNTDHKKHLKQKSRKKSITTSRRVGGGAIITDTKTSSFSLFGESKKGIQSWFKKQKKKSTPKLAVSRADRRKGVIQQATTKSGTIFTADNETLKARIKARKLQEQNKPHDPETNWSPYTDAGYNLLEPGHPDTVPARSATDNVVVEFKQRSVPVELSEEKHVLESVMSEEDVLEPEPVVVEPVTVPTPEPEPELILEPEVVSTETTEPDPEKQTSLSKPVLVEEDVVDRDETEMTTNQLTMYISGGLALLLITGFFGLIIFNAQSNDSSISNSQIEQISLWTTTEVITVDQTFSGASLRSIVGKDPYNEVVLVNSDNELLPATQIFSIITPDLPASIRQFATDVRFVQYKTTVPQMIITVVDPTSVTGTLLAQEQNLSDAMTSLYGQTKAGTFKDQTIAGTDVRILVSDNRQTLTYGIIDGTTLVITSSPAAFAEISTLFTN